MRVTLPVCEEHWYGNWRSERNHLRLRLNDLRVLLHHGLEVIDGPSSSGRVLKVEPCACGCGGIPVIDDSTDG
jgi:hypothetical protein